MIVAIHTRHDANVSIATPDTVHYVELEKHTGQRYFAFSKEPSRFKEELVRYVLPLLKGECPEAVLYSWLQPGQLEVLQHLFPATRRFVAEGHHVCHVHSARWFTALRPDDLIVSYDGGGDLDDTFKVFGWSAKGPVLLLEARLNLGTSYRMLGHLCPEILTPEAPAYETGFELAGKVMALGAYGVVREEWKADLHCYYREFKRRPPEDSLRLICALQGMSALGKWSVDAYRDLQATSQEVFEQLFYEVVRPFLGTVGFSRVLLVGGCALNVLMNSRIHRDTGMPVFVPPCPNDSGISLGLVARFYPELLPKATLRTEPEAPALHSEALDIAAIADMLLQGKILATYLPEMEVGPRALGMRSLLASPFIPGMRDRLNHLKGREWFRPVAPMMTEREARRCFEPSPPSPYMSFAPRVLGTQHERFAEFVHADGSARVQTLHSGHPLYDLLTAFGARSGAEVLLNTSFNKKGKPLVHDLEEARQLACAQGIDALVSLNGIELLQARIPAP